MKVSTRTSTRMEITASQLTSTPENLPLSKQRTGALLMRLLCCMILIAGIGVSSVKAQLTGAKSIPGDYPTLAAAITDLNAQGVGAGGVTITLLAGNPQTAPSGGYKIGGTGSPVLTTSSAANPIVIEGSSNVITAGLQGAGNLNDAFFKLVGADWVTVQHFTMQENAGNTVVTVASNTMTEWGVALLIESATDGSQNNTIKENSITMNGTYSQSFGIYSNVRHIDGPNPADVTGLIIQTNSTTAPNHANKVYGNTVTNANVPFILIGALSTTFQDNGNDWGGASAATGNSATGWGLGGLVTTTYPGVQTNVLLGAYVTNQLNYNFSYNSLISGSINSASGVRAAIFDYTQAPTTSCTNNATNNTFTTTQAGAGQTIVVQLGTIGPLQLTGVTLNLNSNKVINNSVTSAAAPLMFGILNFAFYDIININSNIFRGNLTNSTTGGFAGINCQNGGIAGNGLTITQLNINNNQFGDAIAGAMTYTAANSAPSSQIGVSAAGTACAVSISGNTFRGYSLVSASGTLTFITNTSAPGSSTINNNSFGTAAAPLVTYSAAGANALTLLSQTGAVTAGGFISVQGNDFRGINYVGTATGAITAITTTGGTAANVITTVAGNTFTNLSINSTGAFTFCNQGYTVPGTGQFIFNNNSIVTGFAKTAANGNILFTTTNSVSGNGSIAAYTNNNFSNISVLGTSTIIGFNNTDGGTGTTKTITGNTFNNWTAVSGAINTMNFTYWNGVSTLSNNTITNITGQTTVTGVTMGSTSNAATSITVANNTITGLSSTGTGGNVTGLTCANSSALINITNNTIGSLSSTGAASTVTGLVISGATNTTASGNRISGLSGIGATGVANGISVSGGTLVTLNGNKVCDIAENGTNTASPAVNGMVFSGGTTVNVTNNIIGDLRAPSSNSADAIRGLSKTNAAASTSWNVYYNTVYLAASSSNTTFGTTCLFHTTSATATTGKLDLRNNILVNNSTPGSTAGVVSVMRRGTAAQLGNYATTSNNNLMYAGVPAANQAILNDNGTVYGTAAAAFAFGPAATAGTYQNLVAPRDAQSFSETVSGTAGVFFQDLNCANTSTFLHIVGGITSQVEGGAVPISGITTDFDANTRNTQTPDVGADEFTGVNPAPTFSNVTVPTATCTVSGHLISADINTLTGTITTVTLNYNNGAPGSVTMVQTPSTNTWTGTIPAGTAGATATWNITATSDLPITRVYTGTAYVDDPLSTVTVTANATLTTVCAGSATSLSVVLVPGSVVPTAYSWSDGSTVVGTTNPLTVYVPSNTTYTATVTALGCTKASTPRSITTIALPNSPIGANSTQCGFGTPVNNMVTQFVTPDVSSGQFKWYNTPDVQSGTTVLQSGGNNYLTPINITQTLYVSEYNGTCESLRYPVVETVTQPDPISTHIDIASPCANTAIQLSVTNDNPTPVQNYTYTWTASPAPGSGIPVSMTGSSISVTPTAAGTYVYTVTGVDAPCTQVQTITVVVKSLPSAVVISPTSAVICNGQSVSISAASGGNATLLSQDFETGLGTWTTTNSSTGSNPANVAWTIRPNPYAYPGTSPGSTAETFNSGSGSNFIQTNSDFGGSGTGANTLLTSPAFSTMGYTNLTLTFKHFLRWLSSSSNVQVSTNGSTWTTVQSYVATTGAPLAFVSSGSINLNAYINNPSVQIRFQYLGGWDYWWNLDDILVTTSLPPNPITWSAQPGLDTYSGSPVIANPSVTTTWTATATGSNSCTSSNTVTVTVNQLPPIVSGTGSQQCGDRIPEANVSSNSGVPTPVFRWYNAAAPGGTLLQESTSTTYLTSINSTQEFYVCELSANGCEGPRLHITAQVNAPDVIQATVSSSPYCINSPLTLNTNHFQVNNVYNFVWTASPTANSGMPAPVSGDDGNGVDGGSPVAVFATPTVAGTYTYTVTANDPIRQCTTTSSVTVVINPRPTSVVVSSTGTPCVGSTIGLSSSAQTGGPAPVSYSTGFEGTFPPTGWTIINGNPSGGNWTQTTTAVNVHTGTAAMWAIRAVGQPTNTYAISSSQALVGGHTYALKYWYRTNSLGGSLPENLKVWVGTTPTIAGMTTQVSNSINLINETFSQATVNYIAPATGTYYFAFNSYAIAGANNVLTIDDVTLDDITPLIISSYNWVSDNSNPVFTSNQQNPTGVTINIPTTYTVTVANSEGCTSSGSVLVTPNALPAQPIGTNSNQCGLQIPTASVATGGANGTFKWYNAEFNGTLLQNGGSTFASLVGATTTYWVSEYNGTCESVRTAVTVTVATPDAVTAHVDLSTVCANSPISLSATNDNPTPNNTYAYTWTASPVPGSGIPTSVGGSPVTVTPTLNGTYNYLVTATDASGGPFGFGPCTTTSTVSVVVNPAPVIDSIRASVNPICVGGSSNLSVYSAGISAGPQVIPTGYCTTGNYSSGCSAFNDYISSVSFAGVINRTSACDAPGAGGASGYSVYSTQIPTLTAGQTGIPISVGTTTADVEGVTVWIDFNRNGTFEASEAVFTPAFANTTGVVYSGTISIPANATAGLTMMRVRDNWDAAPPTNAACTQVTWGEIEDYYVNILGVVAQNPSLNYTWTWPPSNSAIGPNLTVSPTTTTIYTATVQNPTTLCSSSQPITVTVVLPTTAPTANPTVSCAGAPVLLAANAIVGGTPLYKWYALPDAVTIISTAASFTQNPLVTTTYRVTVTDGCGNTSPDQDVTVTVNPLPTASIQEGPGPITICNTNPSGVLNTQVLTAVTNGGSPTYQWTLNGVNIGGATASTYTVSGIGTGTYRVVVTEHATSTTCSNTSAGVVVTINPSPTGVTASVLPNPICIGGSTVLTASATQPPATALSQDFESGSLGAWTAVNTSTAGTSPALTAWTIQTNPFTSANSTPVTFNSGGGTKFILSNIDIAGSGIIPNNVLTSPAFSTMGYLTMSLSYKHYYRFLSSTETFVEVSTNGTVWTNLKSYTATQGGPTTFVTDNIDMTAYVGNPSVQIRFRYAFPSSDWSWYWAVDDILVQGTFSPVTFSWTATPAIGSGVPGTTAGSPVTITPTAAGSYTYNVVALNSFGCTTNASTSTLVVNALPVLGITGFTTPTCLNSGVQTLVGSPAGGTFSGPGVSGNTFNPAVAGPGDHTIQYAYTDPSTTCSNTTTISIHVNPIPTPPIISLVNNTNGTSTITATNYTGTLTWSNGGSDNPHIVVAAGPYTVTQTDLNGCTSNPSNIVTAGPSITADPALGGMDITDLADVSQNANALVHGQVYNLKIPVYNFEQDFPIPNGATKITFDLGTKLVLDPSFNLATAPLSAYFSWSHAVVLGHDIITGMQIATVPGDFDDMAIFRVVSNGSCISSISGNFIVDNHASVIALNDLDPGNNLTKLQYAYPTTVSAVKTNVNCNGAADGTITVTASEGTTVTVNGNPYNPLATYGPGTYNILVTATNDVPPNTPCTASTIVSITEPSLMVPTIFAQTNVTGCFGDHTGAAAVFVTGGTPFLGPNPYTYSWNTVPVQTTAIAVGLGAGTYTVTVTDANGCIKTANVTITEPPQMIANVPSQTNVDCNGNNTGSATASVTGGSPFAGPNFYTYSWNTSPVQTTATATGLTAGTYIVTVTDSHGCITTASVTITEPDQLTAAASVDNNVSCNGADDGKATVIVGGGTTSYSYLWDDPHAQTTATATNLPPGTYTVTVTDAHSCVVTSNTVTITQPNVLAIAINGHTNNSCHGGSTGSITADGSGGTTAYTYTIAGPTVNNTGLTTGVFTGLSAGTYTVTVSDAHACTATSSTVTITEPSGTVPNISLGSDYTANFFASNGSTNTIVYNVAEIGGNPAVGDTIRITKVAGYTFSFNTSLTLVTAIGPYIVDNTRWKVDNTNPAFVSLILDPAHNSVAGTLNCGQVVYVAINITRNTPNLSTFTLSARLRRANSEVNLGNNLNSIVFTAE